MNLHFENILIVGGGAISIDHHLPRFLNLLGSQHIDIYEINPGRRGELALRFKRNKKIALLDRLPLKCYYDLVLIATPPKFHADYYFRLEKFTDLFLIEKPMTLNADQAGELKAASDRNNKKVLVHLIRRSLQGYRLMRQFYRQNIYGDLKQVMVNEGGVFRWQAVSMGSFSKDLNGGGVLMDTGPHTLDLLWQVFEELSLNSAHMDVKGSAVEANCLLDLTADADVPVTVALSRNRYLSNTAVFKFSNATCTIGVRDNLINIRTLDGHTFQAYPSDLNRYEQPTFAQLIDAYYENFVVPRDNTGVGPTESLKIQKLIDQSYEKAQFIEEGF